MANPKFFIVFDSDGKLVTRFDDNPSYKPHPVGTVEVPKALWDQTIQETDGAWVRDPDTGDITKQPFSFSIEERREARKYEIEVEANDLIDAQVSSNPRKQLMMVAKAVNMLDAQLGRGGNPGRDPQQDQLVAIFNYIEEVNINEESVKLLIDGSTDPESEVLVHPTLP